MPGMNRGLQGGNPLILDAFHSALRHQFLIILLALCVLIVVWNVLRILQIRRREARASVDDAELPRPAAVPEPTGRLVLRFCFGSLWILDGFLQLQSSMPLGLPSGVLTPSASSSPQWVQAVVRSGATIWSNHPIAAAAAAVWIQIGIGVLLLVAPRGSWSRAAGAASVGWGLVVWIFGEAFGGLFATGASWLFGLPGAAVLYVAAGVLLTLRDSTWATPSLGRWILRASGGYFIVMGILQAWPGRGFWTRGPSGELASMARQMSEVPQPALFSGWVGSFASFDAANGWIVNLAIAAALMASGGCLLSKKRTVVRVGVITCVALCLAVWLLVQDLGFFGGVGTDPNSMIPTILLVVSGYLAMFRPGPASAIVGAGSGSKSRSPAWSSAVGLRSLAAIGALFIVAVGAAPMALAATNPNADPILTEALNGTPGVVDAPAPSFSLSDLHGRPETLASLAGSTVVLTFLDPVCTSDCPLIAQELRSADATLGSTASRVKFVAIVANPLYRAPGIVAAFNHQEGMDALSNWNFLTGPLPALRSAWYHYGIQVAVAGGGAMVAHNDEVFVIDATGKMRFVLGSDPGNSASLHSSFTSLLTSDIALIVHQ